MRYVSGTNLRTRLCDHVLLYSPSGLRVHLGVVGSVLGSIACRFASHSKAIGQGRRRSQGSCVWNFLQVHMIMNMTLEAMACSITPCMRKTSSGAQVNIN